MSITRHHKQTLAYFILAIFIALAIAFIVLNTMTHGAAWYLINSAVISTTHLPHAVYPNG